MPQMLCQVVALILIIAGVTSSRAEISRDSALAIAYYSLDLTELTTLGYARGPVYTERVKPDSPGYPHLSPSTDQEDWAVHIQCVTPLCADSAVAERTKSKNLRQQWRHSVLIDAESGLVRRIKSWPVETDIDRTEDPWLGLKTDILDTSKNIIRLASPPPSLSLLSVLCDLLATSLESADEIEAAYLSSESEEAAGDHEDRVAAESFWLLIIKSISPEGVPIARYQVVDGTDRPSKTITVTPTNQADQ